MRGLQSGRQRSECASTELSFIIKGPKPFSDRFRIGSDGVGQVRDKLKTGSRRVWAGIAKVIAPPRKNAPRAVWWGIAAPGIFVDERPTKPPPPPKNHALGGFGGKGLVGGLSPGKLFQRAAKRQRNSPYSPQFRTHFSVGPIQVERKAKRKEKWKAQDKGRKADREGRRGNGNEDRIAAASTPSTQRMVCVCRNNAPHNYGHSGRARARWNHRPGMATRSAPERQTGYFHNF